ncbi:sphingomyelin phosphodiesterase 5-like [Emydura macquarii macquarii]|uniref:sphingomyelin phosphodiesterase 5-like n=1 Tax=Emydura macquarii macquarii TaxID=1129001 RepID=UPI00352B8615
MVLRESPFPNRFLSGLCTLSQRLLFPSYWAADQLLAIRETTAEQWQHQRQRCPSYPLRVLVTSPLLLLLLVLSVPAAILGLLLWLPLQAARRPFAYQHTILSRQPEPWELPGTGKAFSFVSANVCLLPDGLAKFSNLGEMRQRVARVGQCLTQGDARAGLASPGNSQFPLPCKYGATASSPPRPGSGAPRPDASVVIEVPDGAGEAGLGEVSVPFPPDADFVCLQEVFDPRAATRLRRFLSPFYEHLVYDVGVYGLHGCSALKILNSGLFLASRYPVLAVQYHCYPNGTGEDALAAKGLLSVQVQLGVAEGQRIVGYLNCTHMQAPAADAEIRCDQLTLGLSWVQLFQDIHAQPGDVVAFDVFCGDLNFDNCSSGDHLEQTHEIFHQYQDPCRAGPRQDKPWAIGTMLNYLEIHDQAVATPAGLKRALEQEEGRRKYLAGPILPDGRPDPSAAGGPWKGRRVDYILYREHPAPISLATTVEKFSFITQLAGCSDHLAVGLRLLLNPVPW